MPFKALRHRANAVRFATIASSSEVPRSAAMKDAGNVVETGSLAPHSKGVAAPTLGWPFQSATCHTARCRANDALRLEPLTTWAKPSRVKPMSDDEAISVAHHI
jgi:hypothetical protein